jgi:hydrogenase-4 component H
MVLKLIKEVFKVGEATYPYPFVAIEQAEGYRGKPQHNPELCIACAACTVACPSNALSMTNDIDLGTRTWSIFYGRCIFCGRCEEVCPTRAISLTPDFELAVMNKQDLFVRADFRLTTCQCCGRFFAPQKEVEYSLALFRQAGLPDEATDGMREILETCPECKRKNDVPRIKKTFQETT